jgi:hypothetical protein
MENPREGRARIEETSGVRSGMLRNFSFRKCLKIGGASRDRTDDLIVANDALSQLSYSPLRRRV